MLIKLDPSDAYKSESSGTGLGTFAVSNRRTHGNAFRYSSSGSSSGVMNKDWFIRCDNLYVTITV